MWQERPALLPAPFLFACAPPAVGCSSCLSLANGLDFDSDGVRLHYVLVGPVEGRPIVLVHGLASDYQLNWVGTRWQETLVNAGFRVIGLDCRGHGHSDKPHDPAAYALATLAAAVRPLLDPLELQAADYL